MLFKLENVGKEYDGRWLFRNICVQCNEQDRVGLIGDNGVGKTTLFDLLENKKIVDQGSITVSSQVVFSRVEQIPVLDSEKTVLEEALAGFRDLQQMELRLRLLESEIAGSSTLDPQIGAEYEKLQVHFSMEGGFDFHSRTEKVLQGLGFERTEFDTLCRNLSGGQTSRLGLAKALLRLGQFLLLDEPTNHLDLKGILWLTDFLKGSSCSFVVVSHDRRFLDLVTNRTWDMEGGTLWDYPANFSKSRKIREERLNLQWKEYEKQQEWKRKTEEFIRRNIVGQKTKQAQARRLKLEKTEWLEKPLDDHIPFKFKINEGIRGGSTVAELRQASLGYPGNVMLNNVSLAIRRGDRIGLMGSNGSGKTTLLKTLLGDLPVLKGEISWGENNQIGYYAQEGRFHDSSQSVFQHLSAVRPELSDQELRDHAARFRFRGDSIQKTISELSGGERSRLSLSRMLLEPINALFLDEPTNHLDISSRESLESALNQYQGSLFVISHDLYFLQNVVDRFYFIRSGTISEFSTLDHVIRFLTETDSASRDTRRVYQKQKSESAAGLSKNELMRLRIKLEEIEHTIQRLESRRKEIECQLSNGINDHVSLNQLSHELHALEEKIGGQYESWEEIADQLN